MKAESARRKLNHAVASGLLVRPSVCEQCGTTPPPTSDGRAAIHGHHHDYSKPYDVEWLCAKCHRAETPLPEVMGAPVRGERNGQARLTDAMVKKAIELNRSGISCRKIAAMFSVGHTTIKDAVRGSSWSHVSPPAPADGGGK